MPGFGSILSAIGAGLGQGAEQIQQQRYQQQQMAIQQAAQQERMLMLRNWLNQQQGAQALGSLTPDIGGTGGGATQPALNLPGSTPQPMGQPMSAGGGVLPIMLRPVTGAPGSGIGIPGAPSILSGQPGQPVSLLPTRTTFPPASAYADTSGPGAPTSGPSPPPADNARQVPGPNDAILGGRSIDNPLAAGQPQPGDERFGGKPTQIAQADTGGAAPGGQPAQAQPQLPPMPQMHNLTEVQQRLQQQVVAAGAAGTPAGSAFIQKGLALATAENNQRTKAYEMQVAAIKFQQTQRNADRSFGAQQTRAQAALIDPPKNIQVTDPKGNVLFQGAGVFTKGKGWTDSTTGRPIPQGNVLVVGQSEAPPPVLDYPQKWEGMPDKPPPGVRPDIWSLSLIMAQTGTMPSQGMANSGVRNMITAALPAAQHALGIQPSQGASAIANFAGQRHANVVIAGRVANLDTSINEAVKMAPVVVTTSAAVPRTSLGPIFNSWVTGAKLQTGDPNIVKFQAALNSFLNMYSRGINPTGRLTDQQQRHAYEVLSTAMSHGQVQAGVDQLLYELQLMKGGLEGAAQEAPQMFQAPGVSPMQTNPSAASPAPGPQQGGSAPKGPYTVGQIIDTPKGKYRVTGGDLANDPDIEPVK